VAATRWFGLRLDMFGTILITFVAFTSIPLADGNLIAILLYFALTCILFVVLDPAFIGLSLAYTVSLSGLLQYTVRLSAEVEHLV